VQDHSTAPTGRLSGWRTVLLAVVAFVAAFWLLRETMALTMPLVTALLLALGVWPMVAGISRRVPRGLRWLGRAAGLLLVLALVTACLAALGRAARQAYELVGDIGPAVQRWLASFGVQAPSWEDVEGENGSLAATLRRALGLTASTITGIVLILFLMLLMLTEVENWHRKFIAISPGNSDRSLRETGS
jgi:AI-2 transport protein TqsA